MSGVTRFKVENSFGYHLLGSQGLIHTKHLHVKFEVLEAPFPKLTAEKESTIALHDMKP